MRKYATKLPAGASQTDKGKSKFKVLPRRWKSGSGIESEVAFEATDTYGNPITLTGIVINEENKKQPVSM